MNVIVRKHYPASRLPEDLREGLPLDSTVDIQIVGQSGRHVILADLVGKGRSIHGSDSEVIEHLTNEREDR